jgi:hypothetical protein
MLGVIEPEIVAALALLTVCEVTGNPLSVSLPRQRRVRAATMLALMGDGHSGRPG